MNILIDIIHPAHVHFFRHGLKILQERGHEVAVTARVKDVTIELLDNFKIPYTVLSEVGTGRLGLLRELVSRDIKLWKFCRTFQPDVLTGISGVFIAHVGKLLGKPSIVWDDTEHQNQAHAITWPIATKIYSPDCYSKARHKKQHFYPGCHELAYLHPNRFTPDAELVRSLGIDPKEKYCIVRFVSWGAHHDVGQHGLADERKLAFVQEISRYARPYITSEGPLPKEMEDFRLRIPVHQIHHVLAFASLCVAEGATVAAESAILGVPAIYTNTLRAGAIDKLEEYGLLRQTTDTALAQKWALDSLQDDQALPQARKGKDRMLSERIDVTEYIVEIIEQYGN